MSAELCPTVNIPGRRVTSRHEPPISVVVPTGTSRGMHKVAEGVCGQQTFSVYNSLVEWCIYSLVEWCIYSIVECSPYAQV